MERGNQEYRQLLSNAKLELKKSKRKDYYKILGVDRSANDEEIKKLLAPPDCLQYFFETQGTLSSFNWDPTVKPQRQYMPGQSYSMCFRKTLSDCRLELKQSASAPAFSTSVGRAPTGATGK